MDFDSLVDDGQNQAPASQPAAPQMFDDLKEDQPSFDDLQDDSEKYTTTGQQAATIAEGAGRGATAGLSTKYETEPEAAVNQFLTAMPTGSMGSLIAKTALSVGKHFLGEVPKEDILAREQQNPIESTGSEIGGNIALTALTPAMGSSSFLARGLKGAIESGLYQGADEIDKANLGQGDAAPAVAARIAGSMLPGFIIGGITGQRPEDAQAAAKVIQNSKIGNALSDMFKGAEQGAQFLPKEAQIIPQDVQSKTLFKIGRGMIGAAKSKLVAPVAGAVLGAFGYTDAGLITLGIEAAVNHVFGNQLSQMSRKRLAPILAKVASSGAIKNPLQLAEHAKAITRGDTAMSKGIEGLFTSGAQKVYDGIASDKDKDNLKDFVENGGPVQQEQQNNQEQNGQQGFAEGGEVAETPDISNEHNEIAEHFPKQNIQLNAARSRVYNYLNSVRPQKELDTSLLFDTKRENPEHEREYDKALNLAAHPLSILNKVKKGNLIPKDVNALNSMYPEVHQELSKRMTKRIIEGKLKEEKKPPYHIRQSMSLFIGADLDNSLTPHNMMAAQNVFAQQKAQKNPPPNSKSSLNKIGENALTPEQSRQQRQNKD